MSLRRDIAWKHFEQLQKSSVAYKFADYALGLKYDMLPQDVVHQAKQCLLDGLGCAIGAYDAPGRPICEQVVKELGGLPEATVFGSGLRTSASNATLVNSFMVRFLDWNDMGGGGHNSDAISGVLAVSEREKSSGRDFLTSLVVSYELGARIGESPWPEGWFSDTRAGLTMPPSMGRLMGLNAEQIANAIGIAASGNMVLHIQDTPGEEKTMRKNIRFGWGACAAILSCMLAKRGFTGPVRVVEGERGLNEVLFEGKMDLERMTDFRGWRILDTRFKYFATQLSLQAEVGATVAVAKENDLKPEDIAAVHIKLRSKGLSRPTVPILYPRNAETADHSAFYLTAVAIKNRSCGVESADPKNFTDPVVLDLIEKITVEDDPTMQGVAPQGSAEIVTKDGRRFYKLVALPHGFADDRLTDREIEDKFRGIATKHMSEAQIQRVFDIVWNVDKLDDLGKLTGAMVFKAR